MPSAVASQPLTPAQLEAGLLERRRNLLAQALRPCERRVKLGRWCQQTAAASGGGERPSPAGALCLALENGQRRGRAARVAGLQLAVHEVGCPLHDVGLAQSAARDEVGGVGQVLDRTLRVAGA
jgi:hypothetical protein